ncbi:uncharacterized protein PAC_09831 [Phialocephala subalpina]|uniref:Transcription factor domain-containing protein n=1 Tax=Phialocephala subalpina TaxID=576137 RepID=A0A1L7X4I4_9HELO|nr:uncharacterized protein PAC_09831 [Phialocephala subalpina]
MGLSPLRFRSVAYCKPHTTEDGIPTSISWALSSKIATSISKKHELEFIVSSSLDKPGANARKLIRSHVMRGKNQRKRPADRPKLRSWIYQERARNYNSPQNSAAVSRQYTPLPMQIGCDFPVTQFACDMPSYAVDLVFKFFTVVGQARYYPIELCLTQPNNSIFIEYLALDALYCQLAVWASQAYFDIKHAQETLAMLQQRIYDHQLATSDVTILVVACYAMITALVSSEPESSRKYMMGLYRMVELRGGAKAFQHNDQIQVKLCRADLCTPMLTGGKPMLFPVAEISWEPYIAKKQDTSRDSLPKHFKGSDTKLGNILADHQEFTRDANLAFQTRRKMDYTLCQEILISILYRLLLLNVTPGSLDEAIYVGMLAFSTNIFLQMRSFPMQFGKLSSQLRDTIHRLHCLEDNSILELKIWLLFVARIVIVAGDGDSWIAPEMRKTLKALDLPSWKLVRDRLKKYLWISMLHDASGKKAFEDATRDTSHT